MSAGRSPALPQGQTPLPARLRGRDEDHAPARSGVSSRGWNRAAVPGGCTSCLSFVPLSFPLPGMRPSGTMRTRAAGGAPWGGQSGELGEPGPPGTP